jgi:hypothetical protein
VYEVCRLYLGADERIQNSDLGFDGDGFWSSSPLTKVVSNVAMGNHGNGFVEYQVGVDSRFIGKDMRAGPLSL